MDFSSPGASEKDYLSLFDLRYERLAEANEAKKEKKKHGDGRRRDSMLGWNSAVKNA